MSADLARVYDMEPEDRHIYLLQEVNKHEHGKVDKWYQIWIRGIKAEKDVNAAFERMIYVFQSLGE